MSTQYGATNMTFAERKALRIAKGSSSIKKVGNIRYTTNCSEAPASAKTLTKDRICGDEILTSFYNHGYPTIRESTALVSALKQNDLIYVWDV